jgi:PST family polysaccharide transporter
MLAEGLIYLLLGSGLSIAIVRKANLGDNDEQAYLGRSILVGFIAAGLMVALASPWAKLWDSPQSADFLRVWAVTALFHPTSLVLLGILRRRDQHRHAAAVVLIAGVGSSALGVIPVIITRDPLTLVASNILVPVIMIIAAITYGAGSTPKLFGKIEGSRFVNRSTALNATNYVAYNAMAWSVSRFISVAGLGIYSRAWLMADLPAQGLAGAASSTLFPGWSSGDQDKTLTESLVFIPAAVALLLAMLSALATPLVAFFLGSQWTQAIVVVGVLPICLITLAPQWLLSARLQAGERFGLLAISRAAGLFSAAIFVVVVAASSSLVAAAIGAGLVHASAHAVDLRSASKNDYLKIGKVLRAYLQIPLACSLCWLLGLAQAADLWRPASIADFVTLALATFAGLIIGFKLLTRGEIGNTLRRQKINKDVVLSAIRGATGRPT